jgi:hypothetical protein
MFAGVGILEESLSKAVATIRKNRDDVAKRSRTGADRQAGLDTANQVSLPSCYVLTIVIMSLLILLLSSLSLFANNIVVIIRGNNSASL